MMHPHTFFMKSHCLVQGEASETVKEQLMNTHPRNYLLSTVSFPVFEVEYTFRSSNGLIREAKKILLNQRNDDNEEEAMKYICQQVKLSILKEKTSQLDLSESDIKILNVEKVCDVRVNVG